MVGKLYLLLFAMAMSAILSLCSFSSYAQCTGNIRIRRQADIDAFPKRGCTTINGTLWIEGASSGDIINLDSLYGITEIVGHMNLYGNPLLTNIDGLRNLKSVSGAISIVDNARLVSLDGLSGLESCRQFQITGGVLTDISGVSGLRSCSGFSVSSTMELTNLDGIQDLERLDVLQLIYNQKLSDLSALSEPRLVTDRLFIEGNPMMTSLAGLENIVLPDTAELTVSMSNLTSLEGLNSYEALAFVDLHENPQMTDISALSSLKTIGRLNLRDMPVLADLGVFTNLRSVGHVLVAENSSLNSIEALSTLTGISGDLFIFRNPALTNLHGLHNVTKVDGRVYILEQPFTDLSGLESLVSAGSIELGNNPNLTSLNGLSSLQFLTGSYTFPDTAAVVLNGNRVLKDITALSRLTTLGGDLRVIASDSLKNLHGLEGLTSIRGAVSIQDNMSLETLEALSNVTSLGHAVWFNIPGSRTPISFFIYRNPVLKDLGIRKVRSLPASLRLIFNSALENVNDLGALEQVGPNTFWVEVLINSNPSLQNLDSLSSLRTIVGSPGARISLVVSDNVKLTRFCGLHTVLSEAPDELVVAIYNTYNNTSVTRDQIEADGPCTDEPAPQPGKLTFTNVTDTTMTVSFAPDSIAPSGGYLLLMRAGTSPYPDDIPLDGNEYNVGQVIGSSTIVVGKGSGNEYNIVYLTPSTRYHFALFSYDNDFNYNTATPVRGSEETLPSEEPEPPMTQPASLVFSDVTDNSMAVSFTPSESPTVDGYITVMRAYQPSYAEDVPVDGTAYQVGNVIGSSSIVVGMGTSTTLNIIYLNPDTEYWFDIYSYSNDGTYDYLVGNDTPPLEGKQQTSPAMAASAYPNPFVESVTIRFAVKEDNAHVRVLIYDNMGSPVAELLNSEVGRGMHEVHWSGTDSRGNKAKGLYHYTIMGHDEPVRGTVVAK